MNILFVCTMNRWRSKTAETLYQNHPKLNVRSAGTSKQAARQVSARDLEWADLVVVMEYEHKQWIVDQFRGQMQLGKIEVLDIPDLYVYMDPELVEMLQIAVDGLIER